MLGVAAELESLLLDRLPPRERERVLVALRDSTLLDLIAASMAVSVLASEAGPYVNAKTRRLMDDTAAALEGDIGKLRLLVSDLARSRVGVHAAAARV